MLVMPPILPPRAESSHEFRERRSFEQVLRPSHRPARWPRPLRVGRRVLLGAGCTSPGVPPTRWTPRSRIGCELREEPGRKLGVASSANRGLAADQATPVGSSHVPDRIECWRAHGADLDRDPLGPAARRVQPCGAGVRGRRNARAPGVSGSNPLPRGQAGPTGRSPSDSTPEIGPAGPAGRHARRAAPRAPEPTGGGRGGSGGVRDFASSLGVAVPSCCASMQGRGPD